jgi:hypothetical protein
MSDTLDLHMVVNPDRLAVEIANQWAEWDSYRSEWKEQKKELRNYIYATSTQTTSNQTLPWTNKTTTPKLTQIYDNLKANYTAAIFPQEEWMSWEPGDQDADTPQKAEAVKAYMKNKWRQSGSERIIDDLIDDFIQAGVCFGTVEYVDEDTELETGEVVQGYRGPRPVRISPYDIVFNPTASRFEDSPKIIRSLMSLGEVKKLIENGEDQYAEIFNKLTSNREEVIGSTSVDKSDGFVADGFGSIEHYYSSGVVEILTFYGDIYDINSGELRQNRIIKVVDRAYIIADDPIPNWLGSAPIFMIGWRDRPDNLYAMGPLDNLVGLQYRIDHLENLKADVFDQIALPRELIQGDVQEYTQAPGERIYLGEEGNVSYLSPDPTALNADLQIQVLENKMEEMAGAPRQAMGIRTPGEKTAFEVQTLQNSASRIFEHKARKFEREFLEPLLNAMLESAKRNLTQTEAVRVLDTDIGVEMFSNITKEDITAKGKIVPKGARHFAEKALLVQNLTNIINVTIADPSVKTHLSGKMMAKMLAESVGRPELYGENILVEEQLETQNAASDAEADFMEDQMLKQEGGL